MATADPAGTGSPASTGAPAVPTAPVMEGPPDVLISDHAAHLARVFVGVTATLLALCVVTFGTRMYQRIRPVWKVGLDDYFIIAGFILTVADWALLLPTMVVAPGSITWERSISSGRSSWLAIGIWGMAMTCIKLSIAFTLLRIQGKERGWRIFLFSLMTIQSIYGIGNLLFNTVICCRPLDAAWNPFKYLPENKCVSYEVQRTVSNVGSAVNIATDVLLSLAPATFLRKLNRPLRERIFVCVLMGMGLFASVSSIVKTVIVQDYGNDMMNIDFWALSVNICTWTALEMLLGVLAACVPAMKGILQACLGSMGVHLTENGSRHRSTYYARNGNTTGRVGGTGHDIGSSYVLRSQAKAAGDEFAKYSSKKGKGGEFDDETCIDLPDMSRNCSTKSLGLRSSDNSNGDSREPSVERLPRHAL
ncbi:hypothetical protein VTK26DRAFT_7784 [Humicola hyalothermophila]